MWKSQTLNLNRYTVAGRVKRVGMFRTTKIVRSTGYYLNYRHAYGEIKKKQITEIF
jgi:hypothetical protein